ncbi:hypothetical protein BCV69DRAFT_285328 [Microstroma glucosiphilum]|uniref:NUDE domain-containing protein n=1 Tax=Pseudomicrostroma glucosiphilum TaxID=1684307 RepID=A0A316TZD9_9BASI|nr:hypothetical protein BCV69DRAFT_285328 [Pseudomicrostroma glucosiphilum]PWN18034.1 hypothetical protein BCV69DRAFT_285328 [Pseudomicrostroma glucosiphilum]
MSEDEEEAVPSFDDDAQEVAFWKSKAQALRELLDEAHVSLRDFEMSSKELEEEMDKELAQSNKQLEEAIRNNEKLSQDREEWKSKYQSSLHQRNKEIAEATKELTQLRETSNIYRKKLRDMELDNDGLENAERMIRSTLEDVENRYNQQMERTTLMEQEIIEKLQLEETNQRLRDEIREMSEELNVLRAREQQKQGTPNSSKSQDMTIGELVGNGPKPSRRTDSTRTSVAISELPSSSRAGAATPSRPRTSLAPRASVVHRRAPSRDVDSPSLATRQAKLAASRSTVPSGRVPPSDQVRASTKMARDLHDRIGSLQTKIGTSLQQKSRIPRPSLNPGGSMSTPLRASTISGAAGKASASSPDAERHSQIPLPTSSLRKSIGRPSARLSMSHAAGTRESSMSSLPADGRASGDANLPRSMTPTFNSARARRATSEWTSDTLQPGRREGEFRPASAASASLSQRSASPLHFLNTEPLLHHSRPQSRPSLAKDSVRIAKATPDPTKSTASEERSSQRSIAAGARFTPRQTVSGARSTTTSRSSVEIGSADTVAQRRSGHVDDPVSGHRPASSLSGSLATSSERSSVSAFRQERLHRNGLSATAGPPPVAHTGLKKMIAAPVAAGSGARRNSGTFSGPVSRRSSIGG